jgi:hypothetical protein
MNDDYFGIEPTAWRITDGEGGYNYYDEQPDPNGFSVNWSARYGRKYEPIYTAADLRKYAIEVAIRVASRLQGCATNFDEQTVVYEVLDEIEKGDLK